MKNGQVVYSNVIPGINILQIAEKIEAISDKLVEKYPDIDPNFFFQIGLPDSSKSPSLFFKKIWNGLGKIWNGTWNYGEYRKERLIFVLSCERSFVNLVATKNNRVYCDVVSFYFEDSTECVALNLERGKRMGRIYGPTNHYSPVWEAGIEKLITNVEYYFLDKE